MSDVQRSEQPNDLLTRLANVGGDAIRNDPEFVEGIKVVVMLNDNHRGGIGIFGYDDDQHRDAFIDMFVHMQAIAEANGMRMELIGIPETPEGV